MGGDEFAVLALDWDFTSAHGIAARLRGALSDDGVAASVGAAVHHPGTPLGDTFVLADLAMYAAKRGLPPGATLSAAGR